ncbi:MAG: UDP-3-O-[3-hydroxymyristoyl] N-acetylglucosamine deacetylase [Candidatus Hydrogenedentes bacterium]|nr:UDP-3-O-[3-hydroxymyristoyl] N-acetylglucosamine deacetylase [Candidatus Hydrogenedentota bacterium]
MDKQHTITESASFSGIGLHTGNLTTVTFRPAKPDSGITFYRVDLPGKPAIPADIDNVIDVSRGTTIGVDGAEVHTVEHVLAAIVGLGVDNLDIDVDGNETPVGDGSSLPYMTALRKAGIVAQDAERHYIEIEEPVFYRQGDVTLSILPADELRVTMTIAFDHVAIGTQYISFTVTPEVFEHEIGSARTFCFLREVKMLQDQGLIRGGNLENAVVVGDESILNDDLRYPDEFVRHKVLDLVGDLFLLGRPIKGHIIAVKSGHAMHANFSRKIKESLANGNSKGARQKKSEKSTPDPALDVNKIMKALPHRFPFLLVDRILDFEAEKEVTGIKNVTINEPFFQGHWPGNPVMPGVLILEALAQVSSLVIFGEEGPPEGKQAFFMGITNAKFRMSVIPGDQIVLHSKMLHKRRNACRIKAVAKVNGRVVAEAEMTFGIAEIANS